MPRSDRCDFNPIVDKHNMLPRNPLLYLLSRIYTLLHSQPSVVSITSDLFGDNIITPGYRTPNSMSVPSLRIELHQPFCYRLPSCFILFYPTSTTLSRLIFVPEYHLIRLSINRPLRTI